MRIGLIADVHANVVALQAVLEDMGQVDIILCAGDIVGYNPYPNETVKLLKKYKVKCVRGNCDNAVITGDTTWFNPVANQTIKWTISHLTRESMRFLETLPAHIDLNGLTVTHGGPNRLSELVYENDHERFCRAFDPFEVSVVVFGHTHMPLEEVCGDKIILNPGSVGQPRDGDPRACYGIYDSETRKFEIRRVAYDYKKVQDAIKEAGLPQLMADRLAYGK